MRVIAGKYGRRKLVPFKESHIRPTTDRVKESIFNRIQFSIQGAFVLDLFSGTGSLAIEALSRGAREVLAVESNPRSIQVINENKKELSVGNELKVVEMDAFRFLRINQKSFGIIFIDPPFSQEIGNEILTALDRSSCLNSKTQVLMELSSKEIIKKNHKHLREKSLKTHGDKVLFHFCSV